MPQVLLLLLLPVRSPGNAINVVHTGYQSLRRFCSVGAWEWEAGMWVGVAGMKGEARKPPGNTGCLSPFRLL